MTPEKQRIAIAEACGWTDVRQEDGEYVDVDARQITPWSGLRGLNVGSIRRQFIPRYTEDLNAMHEAEKVFNEDQRQEYWTTLDGLTGYMQEDHHAGMASAALRAEAFLRTIGKWEEVP